MSWYDDFQNAINTGQGTQTGAGTYAASSVSAGKQWMQSNVDDGYVPVVPGENSPDVATYKNQKLSSTGVPEIPGSDLKVTKDSWLESFLGKAIPLGIIGGLGAGLASGAGLLGATSGGTAGSLDLSLQAATGVPEAGTLATGAPTLTPSPGSATGAGGVAETVAGSPTVATNAAFQPGPSTNPINPMTGQPTPTDFNPLNPNGTTIPQSGTIAPGGNPGVLGATGVTAASAFNPATIDPATGLPIDPTTGLPTTGGSPGLGNNSLPGSSTLPGGTTTTTSGNPGTGNTSGTTGSVVSSLAGLYAAYQNQQNWQQMYNQAQGQIDKYNPINQVGLNMLTQMATPGFQYNPNDPSYAFRVSQQVAADNAAGAAKGQSVYGLSDAINKDVTGLANSAINADRTYYSGLANMGPASSVGNIIQGEGTALGGLTTANNSLAAGAGGAINQIGNTAIGTAIGNGVSNAATGIGNWFTNTFGTPGSGNT